MGEQSTEPKRDAGDRSTEQHQRAGQDNFNRQDLYKDVPKLGEKSGSYQTRSGENAELNYDTPNLYGAKESSDPKLVSKIESKNVRIEEYSDGSGNSHMSNPDGSYTDYYTFGKKAEPITVRGDGNGNSVEHQDDGHGGYTEKHRFLHSSEDYTKTVIREKNGDSHEHYSFEDQYKNFDKDIHKDGKSTVTDPYGLKIQNVSGSPEYQERMRQEIEKLPGADRKMLADKGVSYVLAERTSDVLGTQACNVTPRGYPEGKTCDDTPGQYNQASKKIVVPEKISGRMQSESWQDFTLRHETGHAVDHAFGNPSHSPEFGVAYQKDADSISLSRKWANTYLLQKGDAGREEEFANAYAANRGLSKPHDDFPNSIDYVRDYLAKSYLR
jgi:hypothetical protein